MSTAFTLNMLVAQSDACPTGDQDVSGLIPCGLGNIFSWRVIMNAFYGHFLPSTDSSRAVGIFWQKNVHKYWLTT